MLRLRKILGFGLSLIGMAGAAQASERIDGTFEAVAACDAYTSFHSGTNPGFVRLEPGTVYEVSEINAPGGKWLRVVVPDAREPLRWVPMSCGVAHLSVLPPEQRDPSRPPPGGCQTANTYDSYVLALTWQPGFCTHVSYRGTKPECDALKSGQLAISHLTLHGLWPNKKECKERYGNCRDGQPFALSEDTQQTMAPWMPNLFYESTFAKYEWDKHGVCQERAPDEYFLLARRLVEVVDESPIGAEIKANVGGSFSRRAFFATLKQKLGEDVARKVQLVCTGGKYLQEVRVYLPQKLSPEAGLAKLVSGAPLAATETKNCTGDTIAVE